jgi:hypothetical protein
MLNLVRQLQWKDHSVHDTRNAHHVVRTFNAGIKGWCRKGASLQEWAYGSHACSRKRWIAFVSPFSEVPGDRQGEVAVSKSCLMPRSGASGGGLRWTLTACTCCRIKSHIENDSDFVNRLTFSDESTFHLTGNVNRHNVRTWGSETPHVVSEHERDSPKVNVFCAISRTRVFGPFFFVENTVTGTTYLDMLKEWLFPQLQEGRIRRLHFAARRDSAAHFHREVRRFLNEHLPRYWIGHSFQNTDLPLEECPARSPDIIPCDFLFWGSVKNLVFVTLLPRNLKDMKEIILATLSTIDGNKLQSVWDGWRVTCDTRGACWASVRLRTDCEIFNTNYFGLRVHIVLS